MTTTVVSVKVALLPVYPTNGGERRFYYVSGLRSFSFANVTFVILAAVLAEHSVVVHKSGITKI